MKLGVGGLAVALVATLAACGGSKDDRGDAAARAEGSAPDTPAVEVSETRAPETAADVSDARDVTADEGVDEEVGDGDAVDCRGFDPFSQDAAAVDQDARDARADVRTGPPCESDARPDGGYPFYCYYGAGGHCGDAGTWPICVDGHWTCRSHESPQWACTCFGQPSDPACVCTTNEFVYPRPGCGRG
jgi:hypothetical protein